MPTNHNAVATTGWAITPVDRLDFSGTFRSNRRLRESLGDRFDQVGEPRDVEFVIRETARKFLPYGSDQSEYPEDLWQWLEDTQSRTGARFIAMPHNSNVSKGFMYDTKTLKQAPITAEYAERRMRWEPVSEITQIRVRVLRSRPGRVQSAPKTFSAATSRNFCMTGSS